jgi:hypothetical protein
MLQDVTLEFKDNALGILPEETDKLIVVMGVSSAGTPNTLYPIASDAQLAAIGFGPGPEAVRHILDVAGRCYFVPITQSTAGAASAVAQPSGSPPAVGATGTPYDTYNAKVRIKGGGVRATATFQYTLDGGNTWSGELVTAATYPIPNSGLTLTFATGTYVAADEYTFSTTAPYYGTSDINDAFDAILDDPREWSIPYLVGRPTGGSNSSRATATAAIAAAVQTKMAYAETRFRFGRAHIEAGDFDDDGAALVSAFVSVVAPRVAVVAGTGRVQSSLTGRTHDGVNIARIILPMLAVKPIGKDPAQPEKAAGQGPIASALLSLAHDEWMAGGALDAARFVTARTYIGLNGFYVSNWPLMSPAGSDYQYIQHGQVIDRVAKVVRNRMLRYLSQDLDTKDDGTLDEGQATAIDNDVTAQARAAVVVDKHAQDAYVRVDRTVDLISTRRIRASIRVKPKGYPKEIALDIGFTKAAAPAA